MMSGYVSATAVFELRKALDDLRNHSATVLSLQRAQREINVNLPPAVEAAAKTQRKVLELLEHMDCATAGNKGWEKRITELLLEVDKQASQPDNPASGGN